MALNPRLNDPKTPLVSITVFNYNYGRYLRECFDSILAQTYDNIEICFSDNASTDDSWAIALEYQQRFPDIFFVARNRQNFGTDANFRNCWVNARGKYFVELCSDDALLPDFTRRCVEAMENDLAVGFTIVHRAILDEYGERVAEAPFYNQTCKIPGPSQAAVYMMAAVNPAVSQIMYRKTFTTGKTVIGGLAARWYGTRMMDFNMCCEYPIVYIKDPLLLHRLHLANDSFKAADNMMEVIGPYVLNHQFAELASFYNHHNVTERLPASIEKVANLALRYSVRALINGDERSARRYHDLSMALLPEIRNNEVCVQLNAYWSIGDPAERRQAVAALETRDNLVTRSVSYDPPPGSTPLQ
ncbi:glycosyltransferase family 2 protein [Dechloromonas denitrificans]|uniref:glycosyltransferase family 2 protein n=1 Tax=Dechloromonas denitrificans TaxID=281362 RepID=UPI001CF80CE1|nr:glycosyltransferase family A protein [Dechloromonas denitrificans]UCV04593.1 glycosyltransferase family 2 protein [Dechloromonas denitrificans]